MQDITYVKQLERDRSEFMHMLSHDLKNPLTAIIGWAALLRRVTILDERGERYLNEIDQSTDRMLSMINRLLETVARNDVIVLEKRPCNLEEIVSRVTRDVTGSALHKAIKLHTARRGTPYLIQGDETRLYHLLLNLADNAIKYSPKETNVCITTHYSQEGVRIQVQDEGPGIPEEDLQRVFDKYYRGIQAGLLEQSGTGLGLAAVKNIVEAHGGVIFAQNGPEKGAIFTVDLPGSLRIMDA